MARYPTWQAHHAGGFDLAMFEASAAFLARIRADRTYRLSVLKDPLELHRTFFLPFAPSSHWEYAGTYRGTTRPGQNGGWN